MSFYISGLEQALVCACATFVGLDRTDASQRWVSVAELRRLAFAFDATVSIGDR